MKSETVEQITVKKGEVLLQIGLKRHQHGLLVTAKAHPSIEEMFRTFSGGETAPANSHARLWARAKADGPALPQLYSCGAMPGAGGTMRWANGFYRIDAGGSALWQPGTDGRNDIVNLAFLRFVGISQDLGVSFVVKGVFSSEAVQKLAQGLQGATKQLYLEYLKPVDMVITMSMMEV